MILPEISFHCSVPGRNKGFESDNTAVSCGAKCTYRLRPLRSLELREEQLLLLPRCRRRSIHQLETSLWYCASTPDDMVNMVFLSVKGQSHGEIKFNIYDLSWTDTKGKNRDCVHCVFGVLETDQNFDQRLLLQQLDCPCFDTFVFVEPRIEGSTEGQKKQ